MGYQLHPSTKKQKTTKHEVDNEPAVHLAEVPKAGRFERTQKQKMKCGTKRHQEEDYYAEVPGDSTPLNDRCLKQWLEETLCHNEEGNSIPWNLLAGAIARHCGEKDDRGAFCLRCHFAIVHTTVQRIAGAGAQGTRWMVVAFDGGLLDTHTRTIYAWDPMYSDRLPCPFLTSCHEKNMKVQHTILGHQKDGWTSGYRALAFIAFFFY